MASLPQIYRLDSEEEEFAPMSMWSQAKDLAAQTPEDRNRYVDFLRALSILVVITGHWLIASFQFVGGTIVLEDLIALRPDIQWLTWIFQVMPIFFIVGGYANAVSLESAKRKNLDYADWLAGRLNRLVTPLLALLIAWGLIAAVMLGVGIDKELTAMISQAALIPIWFLAIYIMVVVLAPATYRIWTRYGFVSLFVLAGIGALVDTAFFMADMKWLGWSSYFWVWLSVHHLGYAWRDGRLGSPARLLGYSALAFATLATLILVGPYPMAMVGSPDPGLSNTLPPKMTLLALGIFQFGLLLAIEAPMRKVLSKLNVWTATVLINSMIMTVYLWHLTVMMLVVAVAYAIGGFGLGIEPASQSWWLTRPIWIILLYAALMPIALLVAPLERRARPKSAPIPSAARQVGGALLICLGVAMLSFFGFGNAPVFGLDIGALLGVFVGAGIAGVLARGK
jgi:hypothetical protein